MTAGDLPDPVDMAAGHLERLFEGLRAFAYPVAELVLGHDQADNAVAPLDLKHLRLTEHVVLGAEAVTGMRADDRDLTRRVELVIEQANRFAERLLIHVREVDQDPVLHHRAYGGGAAGGQALAGRLREDLA